MLGCLSLRPFKRQKAIRFLFRRSRKRVTDQTATLSAADEARIEAKLRAFETAKGAQLVVLIVPTTQPETIFDFRSVWPRLEAGQERSGRWRVVRDRQE